MPRYNGTGPSGYGPGTGWGMGPCGGGMAMRRGGFGGRGVGLRRFSRNYFYAEPTKKQESQLLSDEAKALEQELKDVKDRLAELQGQK